MPNVFSKNLGKMGPGSGLGPFTFTVPTGFIWVAKSILAINQANPNIALLGVSVVDELDVDLLRVVAPYARTMKPYEWWGMRVLEAGSSFTITPSDLGWSVSVDGYQLTSP